MNLLRYLRTLFLALTACQCQTDPVERSTALVVSDPSPARSLADAILIVADDIAYEDLMPLLAAGKLPNIKRIVEQGVTYHAAYANAVCSPTRQSLQLGRWRFGDMGIVCNNNSGKIPVEEVTLAELNTSGPSGLFGKWHMGSNPVGAWPFLYVPHGYETWFGTPANVAGSLQDQTDCDNENYRDWTRVDDGAVTIHVMSYSPVAIRDAAIAWWGATSGRRLLDYRPNLPHGPFHVPPASLLPAGYVVGPTQRDKYSAMTIALDTTLGPILDGVDWENDLVIFVGDNGTPEQIAPEPGKAKTTTFERGIHVPMFVAGAGLKPKDSQALVHVVDVYSTIAEFFGTPPPARWALALQLGRARLDRLRGHERRDGANGNGEAAASRLRWRRAALRPGRRSGRDHVAPRRSRLRGRGEQAPHRARRLPGSQPSVTSCHSP